MRLEYWTALALAVSCGCSGMNEGASDTAGGESDTGVVDTGDSTDDTASPDYARVRMSGGVELVDGQFTEGTLIYTLYEASGTEVTCTQDHAIAQAKDLASTEPEWVYHWAELTLSESSADCGVALPTELRFGLGGLYPEVVPLLEKYEVADSQASLQGFYAALPEPLGKGLSGEIFAMGYAGTAAAIAGEGTALTEAPFPDGLYLFEAVYFLQIP